MTCSYGLHSHVVMSGIYNYKHNHGCSHILPCFGIVLDAQIDFILLLHFIKSAMYKPFLLLWLEMLLDQVHSYSIFGLPTIFSHPKWLAHKHEN